MAKKKVVNFIKLQIPAGAANPAPPVGPALGAAQVNIMQFCQAFNAATQDKAGDIIPVEISVYEDRSFDCQRHRGRQEDRRRHRPLHGRHHRRVTGYKRREERSSRHTMWEGNTPVDHRR